MDEPLYNLGDVSKLLGVKPHTITYALASGGVPEPSLRLGNRRMFTSDDVRRLADHLGVEVGTSVKPVEEANLALRWEQREVRGQTTDGAESPVLNSPFEVVQVGSACHEIRNGHGDVIAQTPDRAWAFLVVGLLEHACR